MIFPLQLLRAAKAYKLTNCHGEINRQPVLLFFINKTHAAIVSSVDVALFSVQANCYSANPNQKGKEGDFLNKR